MPPISNAHHELRDLLYHTLKGRPSPLICGTGFAVPGATLWTGARTWVERFRDAGLRPGDRVLLCASRTPAHVMATIAAWWEGLTLCPVAARALSDSTELLRTFDAALMIGDRAAPHTLRPETAGDAPTALAHPRPVGTPSDDIALIMTTSGSTGTPKRIALSYRNVAQQLRSHVDALGMTPGDRLLSVLPWHHAFGLLVDLWPALLSGATVVVDENDGRSASSMHCALGEHDITHLNMVPLQASALAAVPRGIDALRELIGGIVGGAPISASLADVLSSTRLRVGYGQTEASPGITLGTPGVFCTGALGHPVACETRIVDGELYVRGDNVCAGFWRGGVLVHKRADRWHPTGDLVDCDDSGLRFVGRRDHRFKLDNGHMIDAPALERAIERAARHAFHDVAAVVLPSNGCRLVVVLVGDSGHMFDCSAVHPLVMHALGSDAHRLERVIGLADSPRLRTAKNEIDRQRVAALAASEAPTTSMAA